MYPSQIQTLIKLTNFREHAANAFFSPTETYELMHAMVVDYKNLAEYRDLLYERGCFANAELMAEFEKAETQIELYKIILAELPKHL